MKCQFLDVIEREGFATQKKIPIPNAILKVMQEPSVRITILANVQLDSQDLDASSVVPSQNN